jgi:hypothetical protein
MHAWVGNGDGMGERSGDVTEFPLLMPLSGFRPVIPMDPGCLFPGMSGIFHETDTRKEKVSFEGFGRAVAPTGPTTSS